MKPESGVGVKRIWTNEGRDLSKLTSRKEVNLPFRCSNCDHVVKYDNPGESHCPGCGRVLNRMDLRVSPNHDSKTECYSCWFEHSTRCRFVPAEPRRDVRGICASGHYWKAIFETAVSRCGLCAAERLGEAKEISREPDLERDEAVRKADEQARLAQERARREVEEECRRRNALEAARRLRSILLPTACLALLVLLIYSAWPRSSSRAVAQPTPASPVGHINPPHGADQKNGPVVTHPANPPTTKDPEPPLGPKGPSGAGEGRGHKPPIQVGKLQSRPPTTAENDPLADR